MKRLLIISFLTFWQTAIIFSQTKADDIIGYYLTEDPKTNEKSQMEIYKTDIGTYEAKVVWMENKEKKNMVGTVQIRNLIYDSKSKEWKKGIVMFDGSEYNITAAINKPGELKLRGFLGVSLFGKTMYWTKENKLRK